LPQPGTTERPQFRFEPMSQRQARAIAAWRYDPPYDFYDAVADPEDLAELLDPVQRESRYFAVLGDPGGLVGFFMFKHQGDTVEVGLGLRPDLTGSGRGLSFLLAGLEFAREQYARRGSG
jgi:ribosomal-protein-alanine N-acetyltransferase